MKQQITVKLRSKKTQHARGSNATDICTNCVNTTLPPEMGARFMAGSAPHKSGERRVKSWPDDTHK